MKKPLDFDGIVIKVDKPGPDQDFLVCPRHIRDQPLLMPDNVLGSCNDCGHTVQMRPRNAKHTGSMTVICIACVLERDQGGIA